MMMVASTVHRAGPSVQRPPAEFDYDAGALDAPFGSLDDFLREHAAYFRSLGTEFGTGAAMLFEQAAARAELVDAGTFRDLEARWEVLEQDHEARLWADGYAAARRGPRPADDRRMRAAVDRRPDDDDEIPF